MHVLQGWTVNRVQRVLQQRQIRPHFNRSRVSRKKHVSHSEGRESAAPFLCAVSLQQIDLNGAQLGREGDVVDVSGASGAAVAELEAGGWRREVLEEVAADHTGAPHDESNERRVGHLKMLMRVRVTAWWAACVYF